MTVQEIKELIGAFSDADVAEMDLELADGHLKLKKADNVQPKQSVVAVDGIPAKATKTTETIEEIKATEAAETTEETDASFTEIKAPLAGIFYRSSSPEAKPYVEAGQEVKKGDTIGLIEAMKVMNEIPAPCDGIVAEIIADNEAFVAYEEVLMQIEPR